MAGVVPPGPGTGTGTGTTAGREAAGSKTRTEKVDYTNLPCPIPYEEIHREAIMSLRPELFEGMRFDFFKGLDHKFSLSCSPFYSSAYFTDCFCIGRVLTDGRLNARVKYDLTSNLTLKANAQLANEPHMSNAMVNLDYKGSDYSSQITLGNGALCQASYMQSVTPHFSLGGEVFWAGQHRKSGIGYAARFNTEKMVATGQVASTGMLALSYVQKVSDKVSLASDLMYNHMSRDVTASVGYDYVFRQSRVRGKIGSKGCTAAYLEERLNTGLKFILSAEIDHKKKDYKLGCGMTLGELLHRRRKRKGLAVV
ncbi:mitochondrial import receptor subunit TOM40-1-like [Pyrus ussuriensis x Pyrus communis]|uniref:Mitochondrial import receptor subunit TOM40-1-like n=1 Tax=Pyrus ussuriensis x Pyrus communis TaxID=2448454 RepID=A0A5N5H7P3_9ROSA|nr:mitochondrial import receptor subunit TOM40-1-like [Pyrus ussuriensis x Pyrus communis]